MSDPTRTTQTVASATPETMTGLRLVSQAFFATAVTTNLINGVNIIDRAYCHAAGHPEWISEIQASDEDKIANNAVAIIGAFAAAETVAFLRGVRTGMQFEKQIEQILRDLATGNLSIEEKWHSDHTANVTWKASLAFRTKKLKPDFFRELHRLNNFFELWPDMLNLDTVVLRAAALYLVEAIDEIKAEVNQSK